MQLPMAYRRHRVWLFIMIAGGGASLLTIGGPTVTAENPGAEPAGVAATADVPPQVLFALDDESFPLIRGVELKMQRPEKHAGNPIVARGDEAAPDSIRTQQPAVVRVGDRWQMWYSAHDGTGVDGIKQKAG